MSDLEILREAARLMRERAQAATPGPWTHESRNRITTPGITPDVANWGGEGLHSYLLTCAEDDGAWKVADAAHIASWHPAVALAVADWLDAEADHHEQLFTAAAAATAAGWELRLSATTLPHALAVARAYLGEQS